MMEETHLPTTPALEAAYTVAPTAPFIAMRLDTLIIQPAYKLVRFHLAAKVLPKSVTIRLDFGMLAC
jgi:hypothetical protein